MLCSARPLGQPISSRANPLKKTRLCHPGQCAGVNPLTSYVPGTLNNPNVPRSLSTPLTLSRARLRRPFPQYGQINARQVTEGLSRYHAGVIEVTKRMSQGFGGRFSYTYSQLKDNQVGESNFYAAVSPALPMNNYNYIPSMPACAAGQQFTTACYDPMAEYGLSMLDVPHRVLLTPMVELPFGTGKRWGNGGIANLLLGDGPSPRRSRCRADSRSTSSSRRIRGSAAPTRIGPT